MKAMDVSVTAPEETPGRLVAQRPRRTSLLSAAAIVMAGFVLSRILGLVRVAIQAAVLPPSSHASITFTTAITVPDILFTIVSGGALGSSFIPVFAGLLERNDEARAWRVASGVMTGVLAVMIAAVVVAELAAPLYVPLTGAPDPTLVLTLTRIMLLQPLFLAVSGILMGLYNSYHRFVAPIVAPLVYNVANIAGLLLIPVFHNQVALAAWGVTVGALLQVVVMLPGLALFRRFVVPPAAALSEPGVGEVGRLMVPRIVGQAGIQLTILVTVVLGNRGFAAGQVSPSSAIRFAANLVALPVGIFGGAIATATFPTLTGLAARDELAALGQTVSRTLRSMLFFAIPAAVALMVLRYPVIDVVLRHGGFGLQDRDLVASALLAYAAGVPVLVVVELLPRAFFALKDTWTPVLINLVTLSTAVVLSVAGVKVSRGNSLVGAAVLTGVISLTVLFEVVWLGVVLRQRVRNLGLRDLTLSLLRQLVASEAMAVALLALLFVWHRFGPQGSRGSLLLLAVAIPVGMAVYAGWSHVLGAPELATAWAMVRRRLGRGDREAETTPLAPL